MLSERMRYLLNAAVEALADGQIPLSDFFIREHDVSFHEAHALADMLAAITRSFLKMPQKQQAVTFIGGVAENVDIGYLTAVAIREDCIDQLQQMNRPRA